ncbi:molybdopterin-dependent oxidoreductase [Thermodesulfitimonas sp.]
MLKTEPAADYDRFDPVAQKAYLPRGCMRGASYPRYIYGPMRVKTPLIRVGPRGSGRFRRASWDEALEYIADRLLGIIREDGAEAVTFFSPIPAYNYISAAGGYRLGNLLGATGPLSFYDWYCDLPAGEPETWGVQTEECEEWDWLNARCCSGPWHCPGTDRARLVQ